MVVLLIMLNVIYFLLFVGLGSVMVYLVILELCKGLDYEVKKLVKENELVLDLFDKGVFGEWVYYNYYGLFLLVFCF